MDQSCVGVLPSQNLGEIKRKRKIQYRKTKGRLTIKSGGILNKSIYKINKSLNESKGNGSQAPRVSIQNINAFLTKNRELAKALEDCRQLTKSLENEKFSYQLECIQMKEKLNNFQNAVLKCNCSESEPQKIDNNIEILFNLKENIVQSVSFLENYLQSLAHSKTSSANFVDNENNKTLVVKTTSEASIQTDASMENRGHIDVNKKPTKTTRNKKLQVNLVRSCSCSTDTSSTSMSSVGKPSVTENAAPKKVTIATQCDFDTPVHTTTSSVAIQCTLVVPQVLVEPKKKKGRQPLSLLKKENVQITENITKVLSKKVSSEMVKGTPSKSPFKIYADEKGGENKENFTKIGKNSKKKVTICSEPAKVHYYDVPSPCMDQRLRPRNIKQNYKEEDSITGLEEFFPTTRLKVRKKKSTSRHTKKKKTSSQNPTIAIEDLISLVEESFIAGQASAREAAT